jgi:hypothetical protein
MSAGSNDTFEYVEIPGNGVNANQEMFGGSNTLISHAFMRNSGCVFIQDMGSGTTVDHSYFWGTEVNGGSACHGQAEFEVGSTSNVVRSNNVYRDITGTAIWTWAATVGTSNNNVWYNNIIWWSSTGAVTTTNGASGGCASNCVALNSGDNFVLVSGQTIYLGTSPGSATAFTVGTVTSPTLLSVTSAPGSHTFNYYTVPFGGVGDAIWDCINADVCNNWIMYHNAIVNCHAGAVFGNSCGTLYDSGLGPSGNFTFKDNLYYNTTGGLGFLQAGSTFTAVTDYNSYLNSPSPICQGTCSGTTHDLHVASGSPNPYVNWQLGNFNLASDNANWNNFISLGAPYDTDNHGVAFTTDRGAFQFVSSGPSFTASPTTIPANHSNNIAVTLTGTGTAWTGSTAFSISGVTGATLASKSNSSAISETLQITTGSGTGTLTITDTTDSISTTIAVSTATLAISPTTGTTGTTPTLTLTGTNTLWLSETAAGLFTVTGGTGSSIATPTVTSDTTATAVLTTGSANATETITDTSTTATATFTVATPTTPTVTTGTAGSITPTTAAVNGNSYVCTGSCTAVSSEGTCYSTSSNPTTPCTSDGTATPWNSTISGLTSNTIYHYRAFATNSAGTAYGSDQTFTTPIISHVAGACSTAADETGASGSWTFACTPSLVNDAIAFFVQCHPTAGTITGITLTSPGWTITQIVPPATTGLNSWGAIFGAIAPVATSSTFTATFTGASNCSNFAIHVNDEFSGNSTAGGVTTFNATGSNSGGASTCNQAGAAVTPPLNSEAVWVACLDTMTGVSAPWTAGPTDGNNGAEYQILTGGAGTPLTPAFTSASGAYIVEGLAIAPSGGQVSAPTCAPPGGTFTTSQSAACSSSTLGTTLCSTVDCSTPTANGAGVCTHGATNASPFSVTANLACLKVMASETSFTDSTVNTYSFTLQGGTPTASPGAGTYPSTQTVTLTSPQSQSMCFRTDGVSPSSNGLGFCSAGSTPYTASLTVSSSETITAIGMANGWTDSAVGTFPYTIGALSPSSGTLNGAAQAQAGGQIH